MLSHNSMKQGDWIIGSALLSSLEFSGNTFFDSEQNTRRGSVRTLVSTPSGHLSKEPMPGKTDLYNSSFLAIGLDVDNSIAHFFADQIFDKFPQLVGVAYWRENNYVTIWTIMPELDRHLRRGIFEIQDEAILRFLEFRFDFYVVSSASAVPDSCRFIENPQIK